LKIAFLCLAHHNPGVFGSLIKELQSQIPDSNYFIHVDKRSSLKSFSSQFEKSPINIHFIHNRIRCFWGDISLVHATLELFKASYQSQADYFVLHSGEDAVVSSSLIEDISGLNGKSRIGYWSLPYERWWGGGMFRVNMMHFFDKKKRRHWNFKMSSLFGDKLHKYTTSYRISTLNPEIKLYGGQQWMVLHRSAVAYILQFLNLNPSYMDAFEYAFAPDELFFHTILLNNHNLEFVNQHTHFVRFNDFESSPEYLNHSDINQLRIEGKYLFARKYAG